MKATVNAIVKVPLFSQRAWQLLVALRCDSAALSECSVSEKTQP